jgi:acyl carrier protein
MELTDISKASSSDLDRIRAELNSHIRREYGVAENDPDFSDDVHLFDFGYIDSLGAAKLTAFLESEFSIKISDSDLLAFPFTSIREMASFVLRLQARKG